MLLWPVGPLRRVTRQARAHRGGPGGGVAALLFMPALSHRPISRRCRTGHREHGILSRGAPHAGAGGPGGPLRSRPGTDESSRRLGGDGQIGGAYGGGLGRRYRAARARRNPESPAVEPSRRRGGADSHPVRANGWDRSPGGEERDGGSARQNRGPTGAYAGSQVGVRLHPNHVGSGGLPDPRSRFHHLYRRGGNRRGVRPTPLPGSRATGAGVAPSSGW